ncbi:hypothetical protein FDP41_004728 [Naegleria fowleri]|uniref:Uncharacterized protein n=1 Tax=Naegleria fowleri TaxID=5763 RepID=A0A6A5BME7_NAEFO|nr:uncharacterized protein FDP41_004728 [Naegleria fowleri]KAF0976052.1 hypothetical protein FDP41_004728 [Naegleria fowleri]CAG4717042.1 unnamed protein product [Naegleria fowleri]
MSAKPQQATTPIIITAEEAKETRELFRTTELLSTCQSMKMQLESRLGSDASEFFYFACMEALPEIREQEPTFESNLQKQTSNSRTKASCLSKLEIIERTREQNWNPLNSDLVSTWTYNPRFLFDENWTQKTFAEMSDCFAMDSSLVQRVQMKHRLLGSLAEGGIQRLMPSFASKLRELKAANGGQVKDISSQSEATRLFENYTRESRDQFVDCLKAQTNTIQAKDDEYKVALATDRCSAISFENFFKGMILSCNKSIVDCVEKNSRKGRTLENDNVFGVLACVTDLQQVANNGCAKYAIDYIDQLSRDALNISSTKKD